MRYSKYNVIIIGSGLAGLYLANRLAENSKFNDGILLITKDELFSGSSTLAQGGIVSVIPEINKNDSIESHIKDTIKAGCGINNLSTVKMVSETSSTIAQELIRYGVEFDKNENNILNFTLEAAHSHPRILHAKGDSTGKVIEQALVKNIKSRKNIEIYENTTAIELLVDKENICKGIITYDNISKNYEAVYSTNIVLATGGIGQIYKNTTNPIQSTADGIALAYFAGAQLENMEFIQFHPSALYTKNKTTMPLVSESVRGEGAKLVDINGEYFAKNYHHLGDLAPRDIVARAIHNQMNKTKSQYVNLDISQIGIEKFKQRFPTIMGLCQENNINIENGLIPVVPAQHYFMGGIKVDIESNTSIKNLYAIGECASTGLHGANRLASNSLLECAVFAHNLADKIIKNTSLPPKKHDSKIKEKIDLYTDINEITNENRILVKELKDELKKIMSTYVGIIRTKESLSKACDKISDLRIQFNKISISKSKSYYELRNMLAIANEIVKSANKRTESIGAHYREDSQIIGNKKIERIEENDEILAK